MVTGMQLPLGSRCIKYLMFGFNFVFVITGIILLIVGAAIKEEYTKNYHFLSSGFYSIPNLLIAVGAIIFFVAIFGCCGAVRENYCLILVFTGLMVLVFVLEVSGGIAGYALRHQAASDIKEKMLKSMESAYKNISDPSPETKSWETLQLKFSCCGTNSYLEWNTTLGALPMTCCVIPLGTLNNFTCDNSTNAVYLHTEGCYKTFHREMKNHALQIGGVGLGIAFVQALGIWFSIYLARAIKANYETM